MSGGPNSLLSAPLIHCLHTRKVTEKSQVTAQIQKHVLIHTISSVATGLLHFACK